MRVKVPAHWILCTKSEDHAAFERVRQKNYKRRSTSPVSSMNRETEVGEGVGAARHRAQQCSGSLNSHGTLSRTGVWQGGILKVTDWLLEILQKPAAPSNIGASSTATG